MRKKVIAVPRLKEYKEHVNNHQIEIIKSFDSQGFIKGVFDLSTLSEILENIDSFIPRPYVSNNENILTLISDYIDKH